MTDEKKVSCYQKIYQLLKEDKDITGLAYPEEKKHYDFSFYVGDIKIEYSLRSNVDLLTIKATKKYPNYTDEQLTEKGMEFKQGRSGLTFTSYDGKLILQVALPFQSMPEADAEKKVYETAVDFFEFIKSKVLVMGSRGDSSQEEPKDPVADNMDGLDDDERKDGVPEPDPGIDDAMPDPEIMGIPEHDLSSLNGDQGSLEASALHGQEGCMDHPSAVMEPVKVPYSSEVSEQMKEMMDGIEQVFKEKKQQMDYREHTLNCLSTRLNEERGKLEEEKASLESREDALRNEQMILAEKEEMLKGMQCACEKKEQELTEKASLLESAEKTAFEKQKKLKSREQSVSDRERNLENGRKSLEKDIAEVEGKIEEIDRLKGNLAVREKELQVMEQRLALQEEKIKMRESTLEARSRDIEDRAAYVESMEVACSNDRSGMDAERRKYAEDAAAWMQKEEMYQDEIKDLQDKISASNQLLKEAEKTAESWRAQYEALWRDSGKDIAGLTAAYQEKLKTIGLYVSVLPDNEEMILTGESEGCSIFIYPKERIVYAEKRIRKRSKLQKTVESWNQENLRGSYIMSASAGKIICKLVIADNEHIDQDIKEVLNRMRQIG